MPFDFEQEERHGWEDVERYLQGQETTRQINEEARIQNEKHRINRMTQIDQDLTDKLNSGYFKGEKGDPGTPGIPGQPGATGFSPIANVKRISNGAEITITDNDGTTKAEVYDGQDFSGSTSWDEIQGKPTFATVATSGSYDDLNDRPTIPTVPTYVSAFMNDAGYLTQHQDISGKQNVISDLATIRAGAAKGATALQSFTETDPTVPAWAKAATKPTYTASEIGALGKPVDYVTDCNTFTTTGYAKTAQGSTANLPSVCMGNTSAWGVLLFVAEHEVNGTGTQMYYPIDGTYKGRVFVRSLTNMNRGGTKIGEWKMIAFSSDLTDTEAPAWTESEKLAARERIGAVYGELLYDVTIKPNVSETQDFTFYTNSTEVLKATAYDSATGYYECDGFPDWFDSSIADINPYNNGIAKGYYVPKWWSDDETMECDFSAINDPKNKMYYESTGLQTGIRKIDDSHFELCTSAGAQLPTTQNPTSPVYSAFVIANINFATSFNIGYSKEIVVELSGYVPRALRPNRYGSSLFMLYGYDTLQYAYSNSKIRFRLSDDSVSILEASDYGYSRANVSSSWSASQKSILAFPPDNKLNYNSADACCHWFVKNADGTTSLMFNKSRRGPALTPGTRIRIYRLA